MEVMQIADEAWNSVEVKIIVNCFKKAGFLMEVKICNYKDSEENDTQAIESMKNATLLLKKFR